ncbi:MAG: NADH-quinone oxidoreductase subunit N [Pseudomonadota bacterium]|nr:NADH-quinone oxidoreductase subunit N [Pseudomonadota bacterium]
MSVLLPESFLSLGILSIILLFSLWSNGKSYSTKASAMVLLATLALCIQSLGSPEKIIWWQGMFIQDKLAQFAKILLCCTTLVIVLCSENEQKDFGFPTLEFNILILLSTLGMLVTVSAGHLITLFVGLELMYLPLYALVAMRKKHLQAQEAAIKYIVTGALASAFFLYGASLLYGVSATMELRGIESALFNLLSNNIGGMEKIPLIDNYILAVFATVMILAALIFKFGTVPFHMWVPDVYQGSTHIAISVIGSLPKFVLVVVWSRLFGYQGALSPMSDIWAPPLLILGVLSILYGNLLGLVQTNIKRLLAYSSIAHMGYILLALGMASQIGMQSAFVYVLGYIIVSVTLFITLAQFRKAGDEMTKIDDFKGLYYRHPGYALVFTIALFSLIGVPPVLGFIVKMQLIFSLIEQNLAEIAILAVLGSVLGAYYYLSIIQRMMFQKATDSVVSIQLQYARISVLLITIGSTMLILFSFIPYGLFEFAQIVV